MTELELEAVVEDELRLQTTVGKKELAVELRQTVSISRGALVPIGHGVDVAGTRPATSQPSRVLRAVLYGRSVAVRLAI